MWHIQNNYKLYSAQSMNTSHGEKNDNNNNKTHDIVIFRANYDCSN